jgi:hypothetical protein
VATVIQAVSAALISAAAAEAGVANKIDTRQPGAANIAARHENAPIGFPHPAVDLEIADQAPFPAAMEVARG